MLDFWTKTRPVSTGPEVRSSTILYSGEFNFWTGFQLQSQLCGGGTWLTKAVPTSTAKKPKEVMHFRVWNVTRSGNFLWVWQSALGRSQTGFWTNMIRKFIHQFSGHFLTWALKNIACTMDIAHCFLTKSIREKCRLIPSFTSYSILRNVNGLH